MNGFFKGIKLPKVSDEDRHLCDMDITSKEVEDAIDTLAVGKACGPDGLPPEIYKAFKSIFSPLLVRMFKHSLSIKKLPQSLQMSTINVLLKENKDSNNPASYRPISIQNTDCKILAKLLASRL
uniref:Reverse transcriptase domain-containing protein n=1 Tax=Myripristis murdjan TaxID=586833 RepID=A0A667Z7M5_9TELE